MSQNARALDNDDQKLSNDGAMTDSNIKQEKVSGILSAFLSASDIYIFNKWTKIESKFKSITSTG